MKSIYEKFAKRTLLVILTVHFTILSFSATYYVSNAGNNSNSGLTEALAWQTLAKVNAATFVAGDQILFKRGDTFYGSLTVNQSGTSGNRITYGAYGTGSNPIITGFTAVTAWTNLGSNIWESTNAVSTLTTLNMVTINDINTPMGREPDAGYFYYQSFSGATSITTNNLNGTPNWTGAEVAFNNTPYTLKRATITSQSGGTLNFATVGYIQKSNQQLIIQNDIRTLNIQNEWYYNPSTKKISVYNSTQPSNVKISSVEKLIVISSSDYVTIKDIDFTGSNFRAIEITSSDYMTIQNCNFSYNGADCIYGGYYYTTGLNVKNCTFNESNNGAIGVSPYFSSNIIQSNTVNNTSMIYGAGVKVTSGTNDAGVGTGISAHGDGALIEKKEVNVEANDYVVGSLSDVDALGNDLKYQILNSPTKLSIKGTCYYISNRGNDTNRGKLPNEAWASLSKVASAELKSGDVVLFERGGTWRGSLTTKEGITYSAFGKGDKPKIIGSPQNYSVRDKWKKTNTPNVYFYDQVFSNDAGVLIFNQDQSYTYKKVVGIDGFSGNIGQLKNDLEMYHSITDKKIYLYSDKGNPADRYSSIEFCLRAHIIKIGGDNVTIDNICVKYGGAHGISSNSRIGLKVTNCEFGWIGGSIQSETTRYGNAVEIYGACKDFLVDHCYIYQIYDAGITHQYKNYASSETINMENVTYSNNLIEYCSYSIEYFLDQPLSEKDVMKNISFKNNICRFAGYGFGWQRPNKVASHIQGGWLGVKRKYPADNFSIEGNIFDRSIDVLLSISALKEEHLPKMKNNVYIQSSNKNFGMVGVEYKQYYSFNQGIGELIKQKGIDENPTIIFVE